MIIVEVQALETTKLNELRYELIANTSTDNVRGWRTLVLCNQRSLIILESGNFKTTFTKAARYLDREFARNSEFHMLIKYSLFVGKVTVETQYWLAKCYGIFSPSRFDVDVLGLGELIGKPMAVRLKECLNIKNVLKIIVDNRKVQLKEIVDILKIFQDLIFPTLYENACVACEIYYPPEYRMYS